MKSRAVVSIQKGQIRLELDGIRAVLVTFTATGAPGTELALAVIIPSKVAGPIVGRASNTRVAPFSLSTGSLLRER